jgi:hypothetical protein
VGILEVDVFDEDAGQGTDIEKFLSVWRAFVIYNTPISGIPWWFR